MGSEPNRLSPFQKFTKKADASSFLDRLLQYFTPLGIKRVFLRNFLNHLLNSSTFLFLHQ